MPAKRCTVTITPSTPTPLIPDFIMFDGTTSRQRQRNGQVIRHPKESGEDGLADDVQFDPVMLQMTAHFTDHPLYYGPDFAGYDGRAGELLEAVYDLQDRKVPVTLVIPDRIFENMVIETMGDARTVETGSDKDIDLRFVHVEIGDLTLVSALVDAQTQALGDANPLDIGYLP